MAVTAVVLAAGRGIRMGGGEHKSLVPLDGREPLLHYILAGLHRVGIVSLLVVTGWRHDDVAAYVTERWKGEVQFARNPRYASWGNFHSLRVAIDQSPADALLVVNCDVVVNPDVYGRVRDTDGELVLAVERRLRLDDEDMRVRLQGNQVKAIGKDLPRAHGHGEFCGVSYLRSEAKRAYSDIASAVEWQGRTNIYYEDVYAEILNVVDARAAFVEAGEYAEVDEPGDVPGALRVIERFAPVREEQQTAEISE
ncbi:MAG TPA: NTP transferase domain-containing protein [Actinomycetota bacterium]|nr:NTP transferase domain-containing protein [Actinomycetota bacterium]